MEQSTVFSHMLTDFCTGTTSPRVAFAVNSVFSEPSAESWYRVADALAELERFAREEGDKAEPFDTAV